MSVTVRLSSLLSHLIRGATQVEVQAATVDEAILALDARFPGVRNRICDQQGRIKLFVHVFVGQQDVRLLAGGATALKPGDEVEILPAIAGGSRRPLFPRHIHGDLS